MENLKSGQPLCQAGPHILLMQTCVVIMARPDGTWCMGSHTSHIGSWLCYNIVKAPNAGNTFVLFSQQVMRSTRPDIGLTRPYDSVTAGFRFGYCNLRTWQNYNGAQLLVRGYDAIPGRVNLVSNTLPHNIFRSLVMLFPSWCAGTVNRVCITSPFR